MKSLFLTILLLDLLSALQAQDLLTFPSEELNITGTWYTKAFVVNMPHDWKGPGKVFPVTVTALEDGSWEAKTTLLIQGRCLEKKVTLQKTEEPGRYSAYHGKKFVYIEELPESDHCIFYCESQDPGKKFRMGKLMGRSPEENLEALEEFRKFTQRKGLLAETIFTPEQTDTCVPEHD
uniref:Lipocalin/cytosolic fatty-acid binding domain-containing protein n=1 Tax=Marmota marmota marmota TaxID=9994 RepID=A0A8C5ZAG9_MARMA